MSTFYLEILAPERALYRGECESLVVPLSDGQLGVLAGHSRMIAAIVPGEIAYTVPGEGKRVAAVTSGMVNIAGNRVRVLTDTALFPEEIDEESERRNADIARLQLAQKQSRHEYLLSQLTFARAVNNLRFKRHQNQDLH